MRKFLVIVIPIVTLVLFVLIMLSGDVLKKSLRSDDNIPQSIESLIKDVDTEDWEAAYQDTERLNSAWRKVTKRIQFSSERNEINDFSKSLARLRGAIQAKDKSSGLQELNEAYEHWKDLGK
jgi:prephenate dehydrogenase